MGISATCAEFILQAHAGGVSFRETATLGRQNLSVNDDVLGRLLKRYGVPGFDGAGGGPRYADPFFRALGAARTDSIDANTYEGSTILHDMNLPVPADLHKRYDCVVDSGSLEHIFAFPTAIRNCMEMVKVGGHLLVLTPANNFFGHGFYQFSPELFFRVLSPENGFRVERMLAIEVETMSHLTPQGVRAYEEHGRPRTVLDPAVTGRRGILRNRKNVLLFIQAVREADAVLFARTPQQSDYVALWDETGRAPGSRPAGRALRERLKALVPAYLKMRYHHRAASFGNRSAFR